jgi:hypothetical protein
VVETVELVLKAHGQDSYIGQEAGSLHNRMRLTIGRARRDLLCYCAVCYCHPHVLWEWADEGAGEVGEPS